MKIGKRNLDIVKVESRFL